MLLVCFFLFLNQHFSSTDTTNKPLNENINNNGDANNIAEFLEDSDDEMMDIEDEKEQTLDSKPKSFFTRKNLSQLLNHVHYEACEIQLRVILKKPLTWIVRKRGIFSCFHFNVMFTNFIYR